MKKRYKAILFDMDGTLLPMNMEEFTSGYFKFLCKKLSRYGIDDRKLVSTIWDGTKAMVMNDGSTNNEAVFWKRFEELVGGPVEAIKADCDSFYSNEFMEAKCFTQDNPLAKEAVRVAHEKAEYVILATNPLFPMVGQISRMKWVDLKPEDFDLVTSYESDRFCKPNPMYFIEVLKRMNLKPQDCLMVGNDEHEDMHCCTQAGIDGYLVTDTMIASDKYPWEGDRGSFAQLVESLKGLDGYEAQ